MFEHRRTRKAIEKSVQPVVESLEGRRLLSVSLSHGVLNVTGTHGADDISISADPTTPGMVDVSLNGKMSTFSAAKISRIKINAGAGNDMVTEDASVTDASSMVGGAGSDTLVAGAGNDSLDGGAGNDSLEAGAGNDTLKGGTGNDSLQAGAGKDSVDGGAGNDSLEAGAGTASLQGGAGNDTLQGGTGQCVLDGGKGTDHVGFALAAGVPISQVPAAVATGLTTLAQGATITTVQTFHDDSQTYYGTVVSINGVDTRIVVDSKGNPVSNGTDNNGGPDDHGGAFGSVVSVDTAANKITLKVTSEHAAAKQTTFTIGAGATITVDGATATLASLTAGTWVAVQTSSAEPTTVTSIIAFGKRVEGTVTAVDTTANTITLTGHDGGTATTYKVPTTATISFDGASAALSAITVGSEALIKLSASDATTALSIDAAALPTGGDNSGGGQGGDPGGPPLPIGGGGGIGDLGHHGGSFGSVVSTDTTAKTITVSLRSDFGPPTQTTFTLATGATVTVDGSAGTLASLVAGEKITWTVSATDPTMLTAISAVGGRVVGIVSAVDATAKTITLQGHEGDPAQTYTLTNAAVVTVSGTTSTLSSVTAGMIVELQLTADDATKALSLTAIPAPLGGPPHDGGPGPDGGGQHP
jgi:hypothetical protein